MIINEDHPNLSIYRLGGSLISILTNSPLEKFDVLYLYDSFKEITSNDISFGYFMLTLDWLYLLNLVELTENGDIKKCY
ncbi:ABC-three component system middle component 6 [Acinetobacter haemolyticus]|uniref:ABC-three component system middle component 6 n=1 Tax=Acinetobacter haemolyticus TaxID=29430 RepID=UPI002A6A0A81|nr:ABC-three component system middle component 6 [Acinetobacter haemolyticus]WPO67184.1 ABC-three component system middle component 6 [Acinetobacter haemolyticus]